MRKRLGLVVRLTNQPPGSKSLPLRKTFGIHQPLCSIPSDSCAQEPKGSPTLSNTFEDRVTTVWVQDVETTIALPNTARRAAPTPARDEFASMDVSLSEVIGAAWFAVAKLSEEGQVYGLQTILKAESRFEAGILYRLTLELRVQGQTEVHQVIVLAQPWTRSWQLVTDAVRS